MRRDGAAEDRDDLLRSQRRHQLGCRKGVVLHKTPYFFGVSEWEFFWPLTQGAALALTKNEGERDPEYLARALDACGCTCAFFAPSQLGILLELLAATPAHEPEASHFCFAQSDWVERHATQHLPALRAVFTCGEALSASVVGLCGAQLPRAALVNLYGPTEADVTYWEAPRPRGAGCASPSVSRVPIGVPIEHVRLVVLDATGRDLAPRGVPGELAFVGVVAAGYLGRVDATKAAFLDEAPARLRRHAEDRVYRTGDVARWGADGELEFIGRVDSQIKLRGFRIELGEIDCAVAACDRVAQCATLVRGAGDQRQLVTYVRPASVDCARVKRQLAAKLPHYMVPQHVVAIDHMPLTERGKLDLKRLPDPLLLRLSPTKKMGASSSSYKSATTTTASSSSDDDDHLETTATTEASSDGGRASSRDESSPCSPPVVLTALELELRLIFAEALGVDASRVGVSDDFEQLGGNSLLAGRATNAVRRRLAGASKVKGTALYAHASVEKLAKVVAQAQVSAGYQAGELASRAVDDRGSSLVRMAETSRALSSTSTYALASQLTGACAVLALRYLDWPGWYALWYLWLTLPRWQCFLCVPFILAATDLMAFAIALLAQKLTLGDRRQAHRLLRAPPLSTEDPQSPGTVDDDIVSQEEGVPLWSQAYVRWWFAHQIVSTVTERLERNLHGTSFMCSYYRALGARIGAGAVLDGKLLDPLFCTVGAGAALATGCELDSHFVRDGALVVRDCHVGAGAVVGAHAFVAPGTRVQARHRLAPLSTSQAVGAVGTSRQQPAERHFARRRRADEIQVFESLSSEERDYEVSRVAAVERRAVEASRRAWYGVPLLYCAHAVPYAPFALLLEQLYYGLRSAVRGAPASVPKAPWLFWLCYPWVWRLGFHELYFWAVVLFKRLVVGKFEEGVADSTRKPFRRWVFERLVEADAFEHAMRPWLSTEVLCARYRALGATIGRRCHMDFFKCVEYDLVTVEDDVVFGSLVRIVPRDPHGGAFDWGERDARRVVCRKECNVLDHCLLMPGCVVGERAVLGTFSLGAAGQLFQPGSVATGNRAGRAVVLRTRPPMPQFENGGTTGCSKEDLAALTPLQRLEREARRRHHSLAWFARWNAVNVTVSFLLYPLRDCFETAVIALGYMMYWLVSWTGYELYFLALPLLNLLTVALHLLLVCALKRLVVGKFKEGNYGFYSRYHFAWALMMTLLGPVYPLLSAFNGTWYAAAYYRLMGADAGENAFIWGKLLEFDLLTVGAGGSIGRLCDATCHTVENMVIKLAPVKVGARADVRARSVVMPGGTLGDGATLLQNSLTLKGEFAAERTVWAGLPAEAVDAQHVFASEDETVARDLHPPESDLGLV